MSSKPDHLAPFRWPPSWTNPAILGSFRQTPINCLIFDSPVPAVAAAAREAGFTVLEWAALGAAPINEMKWDSPAPQTVITGLEWPRMKITAGRPGGSESGPTGAPWIDSNTWVARLASVRAPHRPVWLGFEPGKENPTPGEAGYKIAIADSAAAGARWMISIDEGLRQGLPAGNAEADKVWRSIVGALQFFEKHRDWAAWQPQGSVGVLSSFSGENEFLGTEVLNLAARRNLLYRVMDRNVSSSHNFEKLRAVLYVDNEQPSPELKSKLEGFGRGGGVLIVPRKLGSQFAGGALADCPVPGYQLRSFGKGTLAVATRDWDDPFFLAAETHSLATRRHDPVTLFNGRSLWEHYSEATDGRAALLQLVGFTGRPNESVSFIPNRPWRSANLHTIGSDSATLLEPVQVEGRPEFHLPAFSYYAALEFRS